MKKLLHQCRWYFWSCWWEQNELSILLLVSFLVGECSVASFQETVLDINTLSRVETASKPQETVRPWGVHPSSLETTYPVSQWLPSQCDHQACSALTRAEPQLGTLATFTCMVCKCLRTCAYDSYDTCTGQDKKMATKVGPLLPWLLRLGNCMHRAPQSHSPHAITNHNFKGEVQDFFKFSQINAVLFTDSHEVCDHAPSLLRNKRLKFAKFPPSVGATHPGWSHVSQGASWQLYRVCAGCRVNRPCSQAWESHDQSFFDMDVRDVQARSEVGVRRPARWHSH